ncbi:MAG: EAL domain-containing protein [Gammaproteobacteria bacterium]|nr:EAL domain-containing protein [Gammaproteobacteria bacterium]
MQIQELNLTDAAAYEREVQRRLAEPGAQLSVFVVDMGGISKIFARSGQEAATSFLKVVARLLVRVCRQDDKVCRIGDSAFGIILQDVTSPVLLQLAAEKINRLYSAAISEMDVSFQAKVCIGIASYPDHANDAKELLHNARLAAEAADSKGEPYLFYSPESVATLSMKWDIQADLASAIESNALALFYQPKVSIATGRVIGAEALLRWDNGEYGPVPPDVFIPVACDIGMINELSQYVLTTALRNAAEWPKTGERQSISINLESETLQDTEVDEIISSSLSIWGSDHIDLLLEITESALVADSKSNFRRLQSLRSMGVGISIDDFGTGYSSLSYFTNIPATELKIDKSFINDMLECGRSRSLVETIINLAHRFDLVVVAEGVEHPEELSVLAEMNCDVAQGFHIAEAMSHDDYCHWLKKQ